MDTLRADVENALEALRSNRTGHVDRALALLQDTVFSFSMKVCGHREDAEDTSQATLMKALPRLGKFGSANALGVWLYKVARSQCLMSRRRSRFAPRRELSLERLLPSPAELADASDDPERAALRRADAVRVRKTVQKLPPEYRLVLALHDMEELSTAEVAQITGLRPGTVRVRLHRARAFVRNDLARGVSPRDWSRRGRKPSVQRSGRCVRLFAALSDYLDEELDLPRCRAIESHMDGCLGCMRFMKSLERTVERLRRTDGGRIRPRAASRMRTALRTEYERLVAAG